MKRTNTSKRYQLPQFAQYEIDNLNSSATIQDTEFLILKQAKMRSPGPDGFTEGFYQTFIEKLTPIVYNALQNMEEDTTLFNPFHEANIILIIKMDFCLIKHLAALCPWSWAGASGPWTFLRHRSVFVIDAEPLRAVSIQAQPGQTDQLCGFEPQDLSLISREGRGVRIGFSHVANESINQSAYATNPQQKLWTWTPGAGMSLPVGDTR